MRISLQECCEAGIKYLWLRELVSSCLEQCQTQSMSLLPSFFPFVMILLYIDNRILRRWPRVYEPHSYFTQKSIKLGYLVFQPPEDQKQKVKKKSVRGKQIYGNGRDWNSTKSRLGIQKSIIPEAIWGRDKEPCMPSSQKGSVHYTTLQFLSVMMAPGRQEMVKVGLLCSVQ